MVAKRWRNAAGERIRFTEGPNDGKRMKDEECCCCVASFTWVRNGTTGCVIDFTFTGIGSTFLWDFGDGGSSTSENPQHDYLGDKGPHTVILEVNGGAGGGGCEGTQAVFCPVDCSVCDPDELHPEWTITISGVSEGSVDSNCETVCSNVNGTKVLSDLFGSCGRKTTEDLGDCDSCGPIYNSTPLIDVPGRYQITAITQGSDILLRTKVLSDPDCSDQVVAIFFRRRYEKLLTTTNDCRGTHILTHVTHPLDKETQCSLPTTVSITIPAGL